jgi:hypothetical protein
MADAPMPVQTALDIKLRRVKIWGDEIGFIKVNAE